MITIDFDPVILTLGHFALGGYGLIGVEAIALGASLAAREARELE